ncbi:MAG: type II toxin-antitoxin system VapB family antitoxin [Actinomycetota bacterium]
MGRTNVVIDDELIERVMILYGLPSKRAAIDFALRRLAGRSFRQQDMLEVEGSGWVGDLDALRQVRIGSAP